MAAAAPRSDRSPRRLVTEWLMRSAPERANSGHHGECPRARSFRLRRRRADVPDECRLEVVVVDDGVEFYLDEVTSCGLVFGPAQRRDPVDVVGLALRPCLYCSVGHDAIHDRRHGL